MTTALTQGRNWLWRHTKRIGSLQPARRARALIAVGLGVFWTAFLLLRLLVPSTVGLSDETDGHRYMCQRGLQLAGQPNFATTGSFVRTTYHVHTWYGETCGTYRGDETKYASSHEAVIWLGQQLNRLLGMPGVLDLRSLAIIYALLIGLAIGLTFALIPGNLAIGLLTTIGVGLVYTESVIAVYFVSPYAEPTVWCGFALLLPALLWYWRAAPKVTWPRLATVVGLSFLIITAKTQALGYLPAILLALLWTRRSPIAKSVQKRSRVRALVSNWRSITACVLLVGASGGYVAAGGNLTVYSQLNVYEMVFTTLLPAGHDAAGDLRWLGADPALAYASGTSVVDPSGAAHDPRLLKFSRDVNQLTVLEFIAAHPGRLIALSNDGTDALGRWRPGYLGNYTVQDGRPLQLECRSCFYYYLLTPARAKPFLFGILLLFAFLVGLWLRNVGFIRSSHRVMGKLVIFLVTAAVSEFWLILLTQGVGDQVKHQVFTILPMLLSLPVAVSCIFLGRRTESVEFDDEDLGLSDVVPTPRPAAVPTPVGS